MKQRIITGLIALAFFVPVLLLSGTFVFPVFFALLSGLACFEMLQCTGNLKSLQVSIPSLIYAAAAPLCARLPYGFLFVITIFYLFLLLYAGVFTGGKIKTEGLCVAFTTTFYISLTFSCIIRLRDIPDVGFYVYLLVFLGAWISDVFAYFTGKLFGKHQLCPKTSPKKTVEGAVGAVIFTTLSFLIYGLLLNLIFSADFKLLPLTALGFICSIVAQLGDLTASAIKRNYSVKDYGTVLPGHGGVMDRFDSIMAVAPLIYMIASNPDIVSLIK